MIEIPEVMTASQDGRVSQYTIPANSEKYFEIHKERGTIILSSTNCQISFLGQQNYFTPPSKVISWRDYKVKRLWIKTATENISLTIIPHINVTSSLTVPLTIYIPEQKIEFEDHNFYGGSYIWRNFELDFVPHYFAIRIASSILLSYFELYFRKIEENNLIASYKVCEHSLKAYFKLPISANHFKIKHHGQGSYVYLAFWR